MYEIQEIEIDLPNQRNFDSKRFSDDYVYFKVSVLNIDIDDQEEITLDGSVTLRFEQVDSSMNPHDNETVGQYSHCEIHLKYNGYDKREIEIAIEKYISEYYEFNN
jgi:hypothetical protein